MVTVCGVGFGGGLRAFSPMIIRDEYNSPFAFVATRINHSIVSQNKITYSPEKCLSKSS